MSEENAGRHDVAATKVILARLYKKVQQPLMFFDIETSGLDLIEDEIIEFYACKYDGENFIEHNQKYSVDCTISEEATSKHGYTNEMLKDYPKFSTDIELIYDDYFTPDVVLCGFNSNKFDIPFTVEKMLQNKFVKGASIVKNKTIDVYKLYQELFPNTLEGIYERCTGEVMEHAHSADFDIYATITILDKIIEGKDDVEMVKSVDLLDAGGFFKMEDGTIKFAKGKHKDGEIFNMDMKQASGYLKWITKTESISVHTRKIAEKMIKKIEDSVLNI